MVKIVSPYANTQANDLGKGIAQLGAALFGDTATPEYRRQKIAEVAMANEGRTTASDAILNAGENGMPDPRVFAAAAIRSGDGGKLYDVMRGFAANAYGAADERATNAYIGAGGAYGSTAPGFMISQANDLEAKRIVAQRALDAERYKADNTPINVIDPDTGRAFVTSRSKAMELGLTPQLSISDARGAAAQQAMATGGGIGAFDKLSPAGQQFTESYVAPKSFDIFSYDGGAARPDATGRMVDTQTGAVLPEGTVYAKMQVNDPNALKGTKDVEKQLFEGRINNRTMTEGVNQLIAELQKPNADQTIGLVGRFANTLNGFRAQFEAATRALGGETFGQALENPEIVQSAATSFARYAEANPQAVQKLQSLGIDNARIQSQILDLAYTLAKAYDPGGRMSNQDVERATQIIMGSVMDPKAGIAVLSDLRDRMQRNFEIREEETFRVYPQLRERFGQPIAPRGAAPAAPATTPPAAPAPQRDPAVLNNIKNKYGLE